jgi:hypothetical protein
MDTNKAKSNINKETRIIALTDTDNLTDITYVKTNLYKEEITNLIKIAKEIYDQLDNELTLSEVMLDIIAEEYNDDAEFEFVEIENCYW